jgi:hypothetical protein
MERKDKALLKVSKYFITLHSVISDSDPTDGIRIPQPLLDKEKPFMKTSSCDINIFVEFGVFNT